MAFGRPFFGRSFYGYNAPYWFYPGWYRPARFFSWYPWSYYWLWYGDPFWYDYGFGYGYPYGGGFGAYYGDWYSPSYGYLSAGPSTYVYDVSPSTSSEQVQPASDPESGEQYLQEAVAAFGDREYDEAARLARHAAVEMPDNGAVYLLLAQAQFATGEYLAAAETLHQAFNMLPEEDWGIFVENYRDYYGSIGDYTRQLRALEAMLKQEPTAPFGPFLLGYHYGYLGYPEHAVRELEKAVELTQTDDLAQRLLEIFSARAAPESSPGPALRPASRSSS